VTNSDEERRDEDVTENAQGAGVAGLIYVVQTVDDLKNKEGEKTHEQRELTAGRRWLHWPLERPRLSRPDEPSPIRGEDQWREISFSHFRRKKCEDYFDFCELSI
jgi:hypothetical protein